MLPDVSVTYVPFGVDHRFWTPASESGQGGYVLSVGNDPYRDYETLVRAWRPDYPKLRIVTRSAVPAPLPANVEVIAGDWRTQHLSDAELRAMVRGSRERRTLTGPLAARRSVVEAGRPWTDSRSGRGQSGASSRST